MATLTSDYNAYNYKQYDKFYTYNMEEEQNIYESWSASRFGKDQKSTSKQESFHDVEVDDLILTKGYLKEKMAKEELEKVLQSRKFLRLISQNFAWSFNMKNLNCGRHSDY